MPAGEGERNRKLAPARLQLVVSPENPLARETLVRADLGTATFLLADPDGAFNALMRAWFGGRAGASRAEDLRLTLSPARNRGFLAYPRRSR